MGSFSKAALAVAFAMALLSIAFIAVATGEGSSANRMCALGGSFCARPLLLLIPTGVAMLWALMLRTIDKR